MGQVDKFDYQYIAGEAIEETHSPQTVKPKHAQKLECVQRYTAATGYVESIIPIPEKLMRKIGTVFFGSCALYVNSILRSKF